MQVTANSTLYVSNQPWSQPLLSDSGAGQDVPSAAADTATAPTAPTAAASTPASQFSPAVLSQLLQTQTSPTDQPAQGAHHGHHGHHHSTTTDQAAASTDPTASADSSSGPIDGSATGGQSLAATILG